MNANEMANIKATKYFNNLNSSEQKPAPKTGMGDIDWTKVFAIVGLGCLGTLGLSSLVTGRKIEEEETKSRRR